MSETATTAKTLAYNVRHYAALCETHFLPKDSIYKAADLLESQAAEIDQLRTQLADAERQRDQAVELLRESKSAPDWTAYKVKREEFLATLPGIDRPKFGVSSGEEPAARHTPKAHEPGNGDTAGLSAASATCESMTDCHPSVQVLRSAAEYVVSDLLAFIDAGYPDVNNWAKKYRGHFKYRPTDFPTLGNALDVLKISLAATAMEAEEQPQPDRREQLRGQVKRTDFPEDLTVMELCGKCCTVAAWTDNPKDFRVVPSERGRVLPQQYYPEHRKAIAAATEWLIEQAMKGDGE